jgi:hypothetical protein
LDLRQKTSAKSCSYWQIVRDQQRSVDIPGVIKIEETDGYEREEDGIHFTTKGQLAFGVQLARVLPGPAHE